MKERLIEILERWEKTQHGCGVSAEAVAELAKAIALLEIADVLRRSPSPYELTEQKGSQK